MPASQRTPHKMMSRSNWLPLKSIIVEPLEKATEHIRYASARKLSDRTVPGGHASVELYACFGGVDLVVRKQELAPLI